MLDINKIRENSRHMEELLAKKGCVVNFDEFLASDREEKRLEQYGNDLKAKRNQASGQVAVIKKNGAYQICDVIKGQGSPNIYFLTYTEEKKYEYIAPKDVPVDKNLNTKKENKNIMRSGKV